MNRIDWNRAKSRKGYERAFPDKPKRKPVRAMTLEDLADAILADPSLLK